MPQSAQFKVTVIVDAKPEGAQDVNVVYTQEEAEALVKSVLETGFKHADRDYPGNNNEILKNQIRVEPGEERLFADLSGQPNESQSGIPERVISASGSARRQRTLEDLLQDCWQVQDASNPIAVALALHEAMVDLRRIYPKAPLRMLEEHPVSFFYAFKLADMLMADMISTTSGTYDKKRNKLKELSDLLGVDLKISV